MDFLQRIPEAETTQPYRVHTKGRTVNQPNHVTLGTYNNDCMLTVFLKGSGLYRKDGEALHIVPGMVGLVLPEQKPGVLLCCEEDPYDHIFCRFAGAHALATARRISAEFGNTPFFNYPRWRELAEVMQRLEYTPRESNELYPDRMRPCDAVLAQALAVLDCPPQDEQKLSERTVLRFIAENLSAPMEITLMADHFSVSREYLCRRIKQMTGSTPLEIWRSYKMKWATTLLSNGNITVQEVASRLGFSDQYYFSKVFKKETGKSPSQLIPKRN